MIVNANDATKYIFGPNMRQANSFGRNLTNPRLWCRGFHATAIVGAGHYLRYHDALKISRKTVQLRRAAGAAAGVAVMDIGLM